MVLARALILASLALSLHAGAAEPDAQPAGLAALDAAQKGRLQLLAAARADDALLTWLPAEQTKRLARAVEVLAAEVATLDAAVDGLPPAELLRAASHWHNALDRARAGLKVALRPLRSGLSPLAPEALERRILLFAGLDEAQRLEVLPKLALARPVTLMLKGNREEAFTLLHAGWVVDPKPAGNVDAFWAALLSPEARRGWVTAHDLRNVWLFKKTGRVPVDDVYDSVRNQRLQELSAIFSWHDLYTGAPQLQPGDLLVFAIPWEEKNAVMQVRTSDTGRMEAEVIYADVESIHANDGEFVVRQFPLSLDPIEKPKRLVRPGLLWLRPTQLVTPEQVQRLLRPHPRPSPIDWSPGTALEPMRVTNGALSPEKVVRYLVERAGGGSTFSGFTDEERLAFTVWPNPPRDPERLSFARDYTLVGPTEESPGKARVDVIYRGQVMTDGNGTRFQAKNAGPGGAVTFLLEKTADGWKVVTPKEPPYTLLASRARLQVPTSEKLDGQELAFTDRLAAAYLRHRSWAEAIKALGVAAAARPKDPDAQYNLACAYGLKGDKPNALRALELALSLGFDDLEHLRVDEDLKLLHGSPEFKALLRKYGQ